MKPPVTFWVSGDPKGQPRPRAFARKFGDKWQARVYDAGTAEGWKSAIAEAARPHLSGGFGDGPVELSICLWIRRPKSHFRKAGLREDAPVFCSKKPDADNYAKAVMDALTVLGMWRDDCQVVRLAVTKRFAQHEVGANITIKEAENT